MTSAATLTFSTGEERSPRLVFLAAEPAFDDLRDAPRFAAMRKKLGLP